MKKKVKSVLSVVLCFSFLTVSFLFLEKNKSYAQSDVTDREMLLFSDLTYLDLGVYAGKKFSELSDSTKRKIEDKLDDPSKKASLDEIESWKVLKTLDDHTHGEIFATGLNVTAFQNERTKDIVIAFRGSEGDILTTIDWTKADLELMLSGTNNQYRMAKMFTAGIILNNKESKIYLTGHSLGGFLAQEIAYDLHHNSLHNNFSFPDFIFNQVPFDLMAWLFNRENYESTKQTLEKASDELSKLNYDENFKGAITFNGPGVLGAWEAVTDPLRYQLKKLYLNNNKSQYSVTNYVIKGDIVGGYSVHVGDKIQLDKKSDLDAHALSNFYLHFDKLVDWDSKEDVAVDHNWTVTFNNQLDATTVNNENFYIMYKGELVTGINVSLNADGKSVKIEAPKEGYKPGETYSLYISKAVKSANNEHLNQPIKMDFTIEKVRLATKEELAKARYKTIITDEKGDKYNLYMIPKREKLDNYGSYSGDYGFVLEKVGSDLAIWQKEEVQDYTFNEDLGIGEIGRTDMVSVTKGKTDSAFDLSVLSEKMTVNEKFLRLYGIYKGKLVKLKFKGDTTGYSTLSANPPKFINSNTIQNVTYSNRNEDFGWEYENYRIDMASGLLIKEGNSIRYNDGNWDEGKIIYERWIEDSDYVVQAESLPSVKWDGEWTRQLPFNGGILEIDNVNPSTFDFTLQVSSGAHADFMEGKAQINGNKATFSDTDTACKLTFTHTGKSIDIEQAEACARNAAFFNGEFSLDPVPIEESLYPSVIDNKTVNERFHELTGADYQRFYESMQLVSEDPYDNEVKGKVITGAVRGLFTLMEGIIIIGDDGRLYGAVINDGSVHYYTNNPDYKKRLPKSILTWMERFNHYDVKYLTK